MKIFPALLAILCLMLGCSSGAKSVRATGSAPVEAVVTSPGQQQRLLPWTGETQRVVAPVELGLPLPAVNPTTGESPGLAAAAKWLDARDKAHDELWRLIGQLPAAEPPPGEKKLLTAREFFDRHPDLRPKVRQLLRQATATQNLAEGGRGQLEVTLPLRPLAELILDGGGGFTPDSAVGLSSAPESRAKAAAEKAAREELARKLLKEPVRGDFTYEQWATLNPIHRRMLQAAIDSATPVTSEKTGPDGESTWETELELDTTELREQALKTYEQLKKK